jgi:DNA-binding NtrC family response regulator
VSISQRELRTSLERAQRAAPRLAGLRILWVDDSPQQNAQERRVFRAMNIDVAAVEEHSDALDLLARGDFDIVISDMRRDEDDQAGVAFLEEMRALGFMQPVIFYIGRLDPGMGVPPYAFGITNRPDELLHYVVEIAERRR